MKNIISLFTLLSIVSSCKDSSSNKMSNESTTSSIQDKGLSLNSRNGYNYFFNDFQEILNEFTLTLNQEYLTSQSNDESLYQRSQIENGFTKRISLNIRKNQTQWIENKENVTSDLYQGSMNINPSNEKGHGDHYTSAYIYFYLPSNTEITLENILEHNKYEFKTGFIRNEERMGGSAGVVCESFFGTDKKLINGSGEILKMDGLHEGGYYLGEILNDTIEYSKLRKSLRNGIYFKRNIVHTGEYWDDVKKPKTFSGEIVKYVEYEGEFIDNREIGLHKKRRNGVLESEILYEEPGRWIIHKEYWAPRSYLYFETENGLFIEKLNDDAVSHVWSNQDELDIDVDPRGYKSYTPELTLVKHRKGITIEGTDEKEYVHHGKYEEYSFFPIKPNSHIGRIKPTILANYSNGLLDGNIIKNSKVYDDSEEFNGVFDNGQFVRGVFKEYDSDYINNDEKVYVIKETIVDEGGLKWKEYDSTGEIVNEGFIKITPNDYFYKELKGYGLDLDFKRYKFTKNP